MNTSRNLTLALASAAAVASMATPVSAQGVANCIVKGEKACAPPPPYRTATVYRDLRGSMPGDGNRPARLVERKFGRPAGKNH